MKLTSLHRVDHPSMGRVGENPGNELEVAEITELVICGLGKVRQFWDRSISFIGYPLFRTHILSKFRFNKMSDDVLYEGFRLASEQKPFLRRSHC